MTRKRSQLCGGDKGGGKEREKGEKIRVAQIRLMIIGDLLVGMGGDGVPPPRGGKRWKGATKIGKIPEKRLQSNCTED